LKKSRSQFNLERMYQTNLLMYIRRFTATSSARLGAKLFQENATISNNSTCIKSNTNCIKSGQPQKMYRFKVLILSVLYFGISFDGLC
jgi:hypothetical protein